MAGPDLDAWPILRLDQLVDIDADTLRRCDGDLVSLLRDMHDEGVASGQEGTALYLQKQLNAMRNELTRRAAADRVNALLMGAKDALEGQVHPVPNSTPPKLLVRPTSSQSVGSRVPGADEDENRVSLRSGDNGGSSGLGRRASRHSLSAGTSRQGKEAEEEEEGRRRPFKQPSLEFIPLPLPSEMERSASGTYIPPKVTPPLSCPCFPAPAPCASTLPLLHCKCVSI
jgi:hypothetical protein